MENKSFCFIIPRTPTGHQNTIRNILWELCKKSLCAQKYTNWTAIVIGCEEEIYDNRFIFLEYDLMGKVEKVRKAIEYLKENGKQYDYVIRFDDDDFFSDKILADYCNTDVDCLADDYHTFIEISTQRISQQKRPWLANTIVHKWEHAIAEVTHDGRKNYLLCHDHSQVWHKYYNNKGIFYVRKESPIYLRVLSPFSITSTFQENTMEMRRRNYINYLLSFGSWQVTGINISGFQEAIENLKSEVITLRQYGLFQVQLPFWRVLKNRLLNFRLKY